MKKLLPVVFVLLAYTYSAVAQQNTIFCGTDSLRKKQTQPILAGSNAPINQESVINSTDGVYTIPVMFVIYHTGEAVGVGSNVSDQNVQDALAEMNNAFSGSFSNGIDTRIRFVLARRLPDCSATNGVYRINASGYSNYASQGITSYQKAFDIAKAYPPFHRRSVPNFITIRVFNTIQFAGGFAANEEIFVSGSNVAANRFVLAHEMGHVLNLLHTFEGSIETSVGSGVYSCPTNTNPSAQGDLVADTDPHRYNDFTCNSTETNSCTGRAFGLLTTNLMNYACGRIFTQGQIDRMRSFIAGSLPTLPESVFGQPPVAAEMLTPVSCSITLGYPPTDYVNGISRIKFNTIDFLSEPYPTGNIAGNYSDHSCGQRTTLQAGVTYPLSLTVYGSQHRKIYIDFDNNGSFNETNELVFSTTTSASVASITIPTTAVQAVYLRMRIVVDPGSTAPTACYLPGHPTYGCGEIEDYGVFIAPPCTQPYTVKSGVWHDPTVWSCNQLPTRNDEVIISTGHSVSVTASTAQAKRVTYQSNSRLYFSSSSQLAFGTTTLQSGLVLYLPFNGNLNDLSGNNNHGINVGATLTSDRFGVANQAYAFTSANKQYIRVPHSTSIDVTGTSMTISVWIKPNWPVSGGPMQIVSKAQNTAERKLGMYTGAATHFGYELRTSAGLTDGSWACGASCTLQANVWQHLVISYNGSQQKWYKNGQLLYSKNWSGSIVSTNTALTIGCFADQIQSFFNGSIDEVRLYNRVLSDAEVQALAQQ